MIEQHHILTLLTEMQRNSDDARRMARDCDGYQIYSAVVSGASSQILSDSDRLLLHERASVWADAADMVRELIAAKGETT